MTPASLIEQYGPRESMEYDVVIVGAGPGGLREASWARGQGPAT